MSEMLDRVTGSTGNPVSDSVSRGLFVAVVQAGLAFVALRVDALTGDDVVLLVPVTTMAGYLLFGLWDRFGRPRLPSA
ncbi:hypothetical protein LCGC14_2448900 [marine sediment metagenome]|uniref:Uncharacterized protein n=1 Tax=marine sediment metagenome TaxID=412755 RepID=A0A0F9BGT5_9ZZZZ